MKSHFLLAAAVALFLISCSDDDPSGSTPGGNTGSETNSSDTENSIKNYTSIIDTTIGSYDGTLADDKTNDYPGSDSEIYWEAANIDKSMTITFNDNSAEISNIPDGVITHISNADVAVDLSTNKVSGVEIIINGSSSDGQLKIYAKNAVKLTLDGVNLTSEKSAVINHQGKTPLFLHLNSGTTNILCDATKQTDEAYYPDGVTADDEKRNGCIYSKGNIAVSGSGLLSLSGRKKHGISAKSSVYVRPGATIAINDVADNCVKAEGITVAGGYIWAKTSADAGKCLSSDADIDILGGTLRLYTTGGSIYEEEENDTSSPAGAKADNDMHISGGNILCVSTGQGGKGLNVDNELHISGGDINIATTGTKYVYNAALDLDSSPKGVKADGAITIDGGSLNIQVTGLSEGSEGLESKSSITINNGEIFVYAYDDAINVGGDSPVGITINGGRVFAFADNNDGIDSNGKLLLNGGIVIASGCATPEEGFDCDSSQKFIVTGGTLIGTGGAAISPSTSSTQRTFIYNGISAKTGDLFVILDSNNEPILRYELPRIMSNMSLFFSSPLITSGATYTVYSGGELNGNTSNWNGLYNDGDYTEGTKLGSFTSSSIVTTIGQSNGSGGQPGNGNGGWGPGWWH